MSKTQNNKHALLQDSHLHITSKSIPDISEEAGRIFLNATGIDEAETIAVLAAKDSRIIPFYGLHPWFLPKTEDKSVIRKIEALLVSNPEAGIGECGIDSGPKHKQSINLQEKYFELQLKLSAELERTISIHCVRAWGRLLALLNQYSPLKKPFILHSFHGSSEILAELLKLGGFISISSLSLRNPERMSSIIKSIPIERILIETDMAAGSHNFDSEFHLHNLQNIYNSVAEIKEIPIEELINRAWDNGTVFTD